ncbi:MAG TPA: CPBP family intramembrane glutamic endopeptidase [Blastocatellia bacterium]|nr:CPBP family intramembrane glutamic endopeptidase [Blastocatellia bacterium]
MSDPHDVARYIFINDENEMRSGWRVLAFLICFIIVASLLTGLTNAFATLFPSLDFLLVEPSGPEYLSRHELIYLGVTNVRNLGAVLIASAVCARALERRRLGSVGFRLHRGWARDFGLGSLMGAASLAIAVGIAASAGAITFDVQAREVVPLVRGFTIAFLFFVIAGATEELMFRGFPFQALVHNLGGARAIAITSLLFGLAHLSNKDASALSTVNTILAGIWLGLGYLMTRSLWLATALHWSWNFAMAFIFGLPVSGFTTLSQLAWLRPVIGGPVWVSGGSYGPEAGVAATVALILSTLMIWKSGLFTASEEMLVAIKHGKREPAFVSIISESQRPLEAASDLRGSERE